MLIKLLIPAAIGQFMISQQPKLIAKAVVTPVTHGVVHGVTHALGHGLSRSVTTAVTHALSRAHTHYYYCLYCYYHGAYCQFCEFYNEYAQLGNRAKDWGQYTPSAAQGGEATEFEKMDLDAKRHGGRYDPYGPRWDTEAACYSYYRPQGCGLANVKQTPWKLPDGVVGSNRMCKPCTAEDVDTDGAQPDLFEKSKNFDDCRDSDILQFLHLHGSFCVLAPSKELPNGLRMRTKPVKLDLLKRLDANNGPECDYDLENMCSPAAAVLKERKDVRKEAFRKCREKVEEFIVLARWRRFEVCVDKVEGKRKTQREGAMAAMLAAAAKAAAAKTAAIEAKMGGFVEKARKAKEAAEKAAEEAKKKAASLKDAASAKATKLKDAASKKLEEGKKAFDDAKEQVTAKATEMTGNIADAVDGAQRQVGDAQNTVTDAQQQVTDTTKVGDTTVETVAGKTVQSTDGNV